MQLRPSHSPHGWNAVSIHQNLTHNLVSRHVPVHFVSQRRERQRGAEAYWRDLQNRLAHVQPHPSIQGYVDGDAPVGGSGPDAPIVEADQMFFGGRDKLGHDDKTTVFGAVERGGKAITRIAQSRGTFAVERHIDETIQSGSHVMTDSGKIFRNLPAKGFTHETVNHDAKEYVRGLVHTNSIEAFWSHVQRSIKGTHIWVSKKHLQTYLHEFEFRHNLRKHPHLMMDALLLSFPKP